MSEHQYKVSPELAQREIEGQLLLLTPNDDVLYTLNGSGRLAWEKILDGATHGELVEELATTYGISVEQAARDFEAFAEELEGKGVLLRA